VSKTSTTRETDGGIPGERQLGKEESKAAQLRKVCVLRRYTVFLAITEEKTDSSYIIADVRMPGDGKEKWRSGLKNNATRGSRVGGKFPLSISGYKTASGLRRFSSDCFKMTPHLASAPQNILKNTY